MNLINGKFVEKSKLTFEKINPSDEEVIKQIDFSTSYVDDAVYAARTAFKSWKNISRVKRAEYFYTLAKLLERNESSLQNIISLETGKTRNEAFAEINESLHMCQVVASSGRQHYGEYYASEISEKDAYVIRKPKGVVAVVSPWNFSLAIGSFWASAPAIVEGNCVVHKPSELAPLTAKYAAELYQEAGFPAGVYNMIQGRGDIGKSLVEHPAVDHIMFTGSAEVGKLIRKHCADTWHKSCNCETGSKSAVLIFNDANLNLAVDVSIASAFKLSGQRCVSSGRILIQENIFNEFVDTFVCKASGLKVGSPNDHTKNWSAPDDIFFGPLISKTAVEKVEMYNELVRKDSNCSVLLDGKRIDRKGYFMSPFVYKTEWGHKKFLKEEVFGPHVALVPFKTVEEGIHIYNDTEFGLALGVVTEDFRVMRKCRDDCRAGMIYLNGGSVAAESHLPFGGLGKSGFGGKSAAGAFRTVTDELAVTTNYEKGITWAQGLK